MYIYIYKKLVSYCIKILSALSLTNFYMYHYLSNIKIMRFGNRYD